MQVWVEVYARASATFKIGVWSATDSEWLITTSHAVSAGTTYAWQSSGFTAPVIEQPLGVYLYYWDGIQYVQDDVAYGWVQVHSYLDLPGSPVVNDWGPNGVSRPTLTQSLDGDYMTVKQWLWWWDNSFYTNQTRGTVRLNRLKNWAQLSGSVNFTVELRREDRPSGTNQGPRRTKKVGISVPD